MALDLVFAHERTRPEGRYDRVFLARPDVQLLERLNPLAMPVGQGVFHNFGNHNTGDLLFGMYVAYS